MGILSKLSSAKAKLDSLDDRGVLGTLGDASLSKSEKLKDLATIGATRLARKAWGASGAGDVDVLSGAVGASSKGLDFVAELEKREEERRQERLADQRKTEKETSNDKTRRATRESREDAEQRAQAREHEESQALTSDIAANVKAIAQALTSPSSPLLNKSPFGDAKSGGLLDVLSGGLGMLAGGAAAGKVAKSGRLRGLLSKIPGLGKLAVGAAGTAAVASTVPGLASAATSLVSKSKASPDDITDVIPKRATESAKDVAQAPAKKSITKTLGKSAAKSILKKIPLIGALAGIGFGAQRALAGDWAGAGLEVASGIASSIPGVGTLASLGIDAGLAARDITSSNDPAAPSSPNSPALPNPVEAGKEMFGTIGESIAEEFHKAIERVSASPLLSPAIHTRPDPFVEKTKDLFDAFLSSAQDPERGIYIRLAKDTFGRDQSIGLFGSSIPSDFNYQTISEGNRSLTRSIADIEEAELRAANITDGSGFVPNVERPESPRPYLGDPPPPREPVRPAFSSDTAPRPRHDGYNDTQPLQDRAAKPLKRVDASSVTRADGTGTRSRGKFQGFGSDVDGYITEASQKYGIDEKILRGFVKMEGGWTGKMSPTGAIGTGQFIKSTWDGLARTKEGKDIGMTTIGDRFRTSADPRYDKRVNTLATGLLASKNAKLLQNAGLPVTGENLYMLHNIGPGVIPALKGGEVSQATLTAMRHNGMKPGMSAQEFVAFQKKRFNSHYEQANAVPKGSLASLIKPGEGQDKSGEYHNPYDGDFRISSEMDPNRRHPVTGKIRPHKGVDVAMPEGTQLKAMSDGVIEKIADDPKGYGKYVDVRHDDGSMARYAHLSKVGEGLERGARVKGGQEVAKSGNTGLSSGAHLHMEYKTAEGELRDFREVIAERRQGVANLAKSNTVPAPKESVSAPVVTALQAQSTNLVASQQARERDQSKSQVIVAQAPAPSPRKPPSTIAGDGRPEIVVRNNDSSIRRVGDNMIARTMT